jgi:hypothetical protein
MFKFIKNLFKGKAEKEKEQLKSMLVTTRTVVESAKQPFYHEMIGQADGSRIVRVYDRKTSMKVEELVCPNKEEAIRTSLELLNKHNKGVV